MKATPKGYQPLFNFGVFNGFIKPSETKRKVLRASNARYRFSNLRGEVSDVIIVLGRLTPV